MMWCSLCSTVCWLDLVVVVVIVPAVAAGKGLDFEEGLSNSRCSAVVDSSSPSWEVDGMDV